MRIGFLLGAWIGLPLAALFASASWVRRARAVHPRGRVFCARVAPEAGLDAETALVAERLSNSALVRLSSTISKNRASRFDILGCAIRFGWCEGESVSGRPRQDQDLLVSTVKHFWQLPLAPFLTDTRSYFANVYYGIAPFHVRGWGRAKFRVVPRTPERARGAGRDRELIWLAEQSYAEFSVQIQGAATHGAWRPLVRLRLEREAEIDQEALFFNPENSARGIEPVGFLNGLRGFTYPLSQRARLARRLESRFDARRKRFSHEGRHAEISLTR